MSAPRPFPNYPGVLSAEVSQWHAAKAKRFAADAEVAASEARLRLLGIENPTYGGVEQALTQEAFCCTASGCDRPALRAWSDKSDPLCLEHKAERAESVKQPPGEEIGF